MLLVSGSRSAACPNPVLKKPGLAFSQEVPVCRPARGKLRTCSEEVLGPICSYRLRLPAVLWILGWALSIAYKLHVPVRCISTPVVFCLLVVVEQSRIPTNIKRSTFDPNGDSSLGRECVLHYCCRNNCCVTASRLYDSEVFTKNSSPPFLL